MSRALHSRNLSPSITLVMLSIVCFGSASQAQVYPDRTAFENALGAVEVEDFESVPLDGNGFAAASNGGAFGGGAFTWESTSTATDISLFPTGSINGGADSGLDGTLLISEWTPGSSIVGQPGGDGGHGVPAADDDDFRLEFDPPVAAAGVEILNNSYVADETITFFDDQGGTLAVNTLIDGFYGYVSTDPAVRIGAIAVAEEADADDIYQPPILAAVNPLAGVSTLDVSLISAAGATSEDTDMDGALDEDDNCPYLQNTNQTNTGGLLSSVPNDNVGDDCTCGDLDFDGRMLLAGPDLPILIDVLLGLNTSPAVLDRASVVDGKEANIKDAVFLELGLAGKLPGFDQVCEDGVLPLP